MLQVQVPSHGLMRTSSSVEDVAAMALAATRLPTPRKTTRVTSTKRRREGVTEHVKTDGEGECDSSEPKRAAVRTLDLDDADAAVVAPKVSLNERRGDGEAGVETPNRPSEAPEPRNVSLSIQALLGAHSSLVPGQRHEDDTAEVVLVCEPDLHNNIMGALHPNGALYEKPVNIAVARCVRGLRDQSTRRPKTVQPRV